MPGRYLLWIHASSLKPKLNLNSQYMAALEPFLQKHNINNNNSDNSNNNNNDN